MKYCEFIRFYFNKTNRDFSSRPLKNEDDSLVNALLFNKRLSRTSRGARKTRIIIEYIVLVLILALSIVLSFYGKFWYFVLVAFPVLVLWFGENFTFLKIILTYFLYNKSEKSSYKLLIKNLFSGQSLLEIINDKGEEKVKAYYKLSWSTTIWSIKYQLYGNKGDVANVYLKRKCVILKKGKLKIRIKEVLTYSDLISILKNKVCELIYVEKGTKYEWVYAGKTTAKGKIYIYDKKIPFKNCIPQKKTLCVICNEYPEHESYVKYSVYHKGIVYEFLMDKVNDRDYVYLVKKEI